VAGPEPKDLAFYITEMPAEKLAKAAMVKVGYPTKHSGLQPALSALDQSELLAYRPCLLIGRLPGDAVPASPDPEALPARLRLLHRRPHRGHDGGSPPEHRGLYRGAGRR
jgi:hypothetical protein